MLQNLDPDTMDFVILVSLNDDYRSEISTLCRALQRALRDK